MVDSGAHGGVLGELIEWWEDLMERGIGSQAVIVPAPPGWGATTTLGEFQGHVQGAEEELCRIIRIDAGALPDEPGVQAGALAADLVEQAEVNTSLAGLLGVDRVGGTVQQGIAIGGALAPASWWLAALGVLAPTAVGAASRVWDDSPAGQHGELARTARAVSRTSVSLPIVVIVDDAGRLDLDVGVALVEGLVERHNGQVLVVAATTPDSPIREALAARSTLGLTAGRIHTVELDPIMDGAARAGLVAELRPSWPPGVVDHIAARTGSFAEVFAVVSAEALADSDTGDAADLLPLVSRVVDTVVDRARGRPSAEAVLLAWAGGILHTRQVERALAARGARVGGGDGRVARSGSLVRLTDPSSPTLRDHGNLFPTSAFGPVADAILDASIQVGADPDTDLVERVIAWQAAHRVRAHVRDRVRLLRQELRLVRGLTELGDTTTAYHIADTALSENAGRALGGPATPAILDALQTAILQLAPRIGVELDDPAIHAAITHATTAGAAIGTEARVWAAINLLRTPRTRAAALTLIDQLTTELNHRHDPGPAGDRWRIQLGYAAGRAGHPSLTQRLLIPMIIDSNPERSDAARKALRTVAGPGADTRLHILLLEQELTGTSADDQEELIRLHHALAENHQRLGEYRPALEHGTALLPLRETRQGADHPDTLTTRGNIAAWTGQTGYPRQALDLTRALLPDRERALGADHPDTLSTRSNVAAWTGETGHAEQALGLFRALLPDRERALGANHPDTLATRHNIASWTGRTGYPRQALDLTRALLPDLERVLGANHPYTLLTRHNIAAWTGETGNAQQALDLLRALLPDQERVFGANHPYTLATRRNIAAWTGETGHPQQALDLTRALLPDQERVLGANHPDTLATRRNIAAWTGEAGHPQQALDLTRALLPDQQRVLGPDHPDTVKTIEAITFWAGEAAD